MSESLRHTLGKIMFGGRSCGALPPDDMEELEEDDEEGDDVLPARSDDMDKFDWTTLLSNDVGRIISLLFSFIVRCGIVIVYFGLSKIYKIKI